MGNRLFLLIWRGLVDGVYGATQSAQSAHMLWRGVRTYSLAIRENRGY
jgi:hypothetical protein